MHRSYHPGVIGLVVEYYRPTVVQVGDVFTAGVAVAFPKFDMIEGLSACSSLFERFGGRRQAAGFIIRSEHLPYMERQLHEVVAERLDGFDLTPTLVTSQFW